MGISDDGLTPEQLTNIETEADLAISFNIQQETNNNLGPKKHIFCPSNVPSSNFPSSNVRP